MNKQVVIAGLLGAIAGQIDVDDPTPCEDISTRAAFVAYGDAAEALTAWEGKIEFLEEACEADAIALDTAQAAYDDVTAIVQPFYQALQDATTANTDAGEEKSAANDLVGNITNGAVNTISGDSMLLGVAATTVGTALDDVTNAQSAYDDKYAEINDATFTDSASASQTGFRAVLTAEMQQQSLMLEAQGTATTAESTAITAYTDQEAVVNALHVIEGCKTAVRADLSSDDQATYDAGDSTVEGDLLLTSFQGCCTPRFTAFFDALASGDPNFGDLNTAANAVSCAENSGFNMQEELEIRNAAQSSAETDYTGSCTQTDTASVSQPVNCDTQAAYTDYKSRYAAAKKAERMRDAVDHACTDYTAGANPVTYDCSNGILGNTAGVASGDYWSQFTYANMVSDDTIAYQIVQPLDFNSASVTPVQGDLIWVYRETLNTDAATTTYEGSDTGTDDYQTQWTTLLNTVVDNQVLWTVAEAKYWAYKQTYDLAAADYSTAVTSEAALLVTQEQKMDLLDAADGDVAACAALVSMAESDLADEIASLAVLQATLVAAEEAHAVQVYLAAQADAALLTQQTIVDGWSETCGIDGDADTCTNALEDLGTLQAAAQANFDEIQIALDCTDFDGVTSTCTGFYATAVSEAQDMKALSDGALATAEGRVLEFTGSLESFERAYVAGVNACKGLGYDRAQAAKKQLMDLETANEAAAAVVLVDYTEKSEFATTTETNSLCAYPAKGSDGSQEPRPECKDGYCCGAAQKFLKDGTKLAIETCQKAEGVHTYEYFPPLPEGSPVEPTPEIWRFQCISGAQKLAATAAAALAASYMMA